MFSRPASRDLFGAHAGRRPERDLSDRGDRSRAYGGPDHLLRAD